MPTEILMPALSPTMKEGNLAKWLKKEGDKIKSGDVIAEIETDKATMEVEAVDEGILGKILIAEGTETIQIRLRNPTAGAIIIDSVLTITIRDNDSLLIYMQGAGSSVVEDVVNTSFKVKMNGISANPTSIDVRYLSGDATLGTDFTYKDTTITFLSGDTMKVLSIGIIEDIIDEVNEQAIISLSNATNGAKLGIKNYT